MEQGLEQRIRQRAYEIWDAGGRPEGASELHWLAAEREFLAVSVGSIAQARPKSPPRKSARRAKPALSRTRKTA
jgi:Protein of unknown function (DUF2934)